MSLHSVPFWGQSQLLLGSAGRREREAARCPLGPCRSWSPCSDVRSQERGTSEAWGSLVLDASDQSIPKVGKRQDCKVPRRQKRVLPPELTISEEIKQEQEASG